MADSLEDVQHHMLPARLGTAWRAGSSHLQRSLRTAGETLATLPLPSPAIVRRSKPAAGSHPGPTRTPLRAASTASSSSLHTHPTRSNLPSRRIDGRQRAASLSCQFVLAAVPAANQLLSEAQPATLLGLHLLSDTMRHVFAGTAARTMAQAFIHPIDTVKTRLQVRSPPEVLKRWRKTTKNHPLDIYVRGRRVVHTRNWLIKGPGDIYLGLTGAVLGTIPTAFVYFSVYEWAKQRLEACQWSSATSHLGSAAAGAVVSALVRVPTDTLKHRVQAYIHPDIYQAAHVIVNQHGVRGLFNGFVPTLLRDVPEIAIQFTLYERLRRMLEARREVAKLRTWEHLLLGGVAGGCAASVTMPLDFVKTSLQCGSQLPVLELMRQTVADKGVRGLFAGTVPRVTQTAIMSAMFFTLFETWKLALKQDRAPEDRLLQPKIWRKRRDHVWKRQFVYQ